MTSVMDTYKLQRAKDFIRDLEDKDYLKLKRSIGVGLYLFNLLKDYLSITYLDMLKEFDKLPLQKRIAILNQIKVILDKVGKKENILNFDRFPKKPIEKFFVDVDSLETLNHREKKTLKLLGIRDLYSALWFLPVRYEDRRLNTTIRTTRIGTKVVLKVKVLQTGYDPSEKYPAFVKVSDDTDILYLRFRYKDSKPLARFKAGQELLIQGKLKEFNGEKYMVHPKILKDEDVGGILPFYNIRGADGLDVRSSENKHKRIREILQKLVESAKHMKEYLPESILNVHRYPKIGESLYFLHKPPSEDGLVEDLNQFNNVHQERLIYEEFFLLQLALRIRRLQTDNLPTITLRGDLHKYLEEFTSLLPFRLTQAQVRALEDMLKDLKSGKPMNRLLQGDVGSGKTVVAMALCYILAKEGYQAAVMVPTEILALQHYKNFKKILNPMKINIALLIGSLKGKERESLYRHLRNGDVHVVIGTHALIQEKVEFKSLGLVVVDEQHRFGVLQRKLLMEKAKGIYPHCLVMSATPIPRTLALSIYGDLDISTIDQMPEGRKAVITSLLFESELSRIVEFIKREIEKGNKAYVVYPLIEESEKLQLKAAVAEYEKWKALFPDKKVLLLHGKMKDEEKERVITEFRQSGHVLVSTTVVEVGVDVPEATVMVIESAHRFGLSSLHQLRGRVGRSERQAYCYLIVPDHLKDEDTQALQRLGILVRTNDGFKIAEEDLKIRGPGELLGVSQSGFFGFNIADLTRDLHLLYKAREDALKLIQENPTLEGLDDLRKLLKYKYADKMDLSGIA